MPCTAIRIAAVAYDAARRSWTATVDFLAPGLPGALSVPVRVRSPLDVAHPRLVRALVSEAVRRGIRP